MMRDVSTCEADRSAQRQQRLVQHDRQHDDEERRPGTIRRIEPSPPMMIMNSTWNERVDLENASRLDQEPRVARRPRARRRRR